MRFALFYLKFVFSSLILISQDSTLQIKSEGHKSKYNVAKREDDVYNFGFILLESLVGPLPTTKGEDFLLNEMVRPWSLIITLKPS